MQNYKTSAVHFLVSSAWIKTAVFFIAIKNSLNNISAKLSDFHIKNYFFIR
jgi:hypothetical protein